jgi:hypothetical protein
MSWLRQIWRGALRVAASFEVRGTDLNLDIFRWCSSWPSDLVGPVAHQVRCALTRSLLVVTPKNC